MQTKNDKDSINLDPDELNTYFSSIGNTLATELPGPKQDAGKLLRSRDLGMGNSIYLEPVTATEICLITKQLKKKNTQDVYGLSAEVLEWTIEEIAHPIAMIFNALIQEGTYPKEFKLSKIVLIHKKGDVSIENNYRPIAIIPTFSKIFEIIIKNRLTNFFEKNQVLCSNQHGYRKIRSTIAPLWIWLKK